MAQKPAKLIVTRRGNVAVIEMVAEENRINLNFCDKWMEALDKIESLTDVKALVSTGTGRFYSNGLDLDFLRSTDVENIPTFSEKFKKLQQRLMSFPMVTIAAINGHCFAGGVLLSLCHDYRVMQGGRGWFCMNEVDLGEIFQPYMIKLLESKFTKSMMREVLFGTRLVAKEALRMGAIDKVTEPGNAFEEAIKMANLLTKNQRYTGDALYNLKKQFYRHIFENQIPAKL